MRACSCQSTDLDPYRAGLELGRTLAPLRPEIVLLFPTIHYGGSPELLEGLHDALDDDEVIVIGATGDGYYERDRVGHIGVSALGLSADGRARWRLEVERGVGASPYAATAACLARLEATQGAHAPAWRLIIADHRTDAAQIIEALRDGCAAPVIGGLAGDDYAFLGCYIYAQREVYTDAVALLAVDGDVAFDIRIANTFEPMGRPGTITESDGTYVRTIDGIPAAEFVEREVGTPLRDVDRGIFTLKLDDDGPEQAQRVVSVFLPEEGRVERGVKLFERVAVGRRAQVCLAPAERILQNVREVAASLDQLPFEPKAALIISCAGRKLVLADQIEGEVTDVARACPTLEGIAGFPSFGEFSSAPREGGYGPAMFHNMTYILLTLGAHT